MPVPSNYDDLLEIIQENLFDNNSGLITEPNLRFVLEQVSKYLDIKTSLASPTLSNEYLQIWQRLLDFKQSDFFGSILQNSVFPPTGDLWGIAAPGTYANTGGIIVADGKIGFVSRKSGVWTKVEVDMSSAGIVPNDWFNYSEEIVENISFTLGSGQIALNGSVNTSVNWLRLVADVTNGDKLKITGLGSFQLSSYIPPYTRIAFYNGSTYLSRIDWIDGVNEYEITVPANATKIGIQVAGGTNVGSNLSTSPYNSTVKVKKVIGVSGERISIKKERLEQYPNDESANTLDYFCFAHFSFDDTIEALKNIISNVNIYESIFEDPFFGFLKQMNDDYGAVFSLYCFNNDSSGYSIANLPTKFALELSDCWKWLKFGFHSANSTTNYASGTTAGAKSDYDTFINAVVPFSSVRNIDRAPRLQNFAGNLDSCVAMRDTNVGIVGLLSADDSRNSYYLSTAQSTYINSHENILDTANYLKFFKSETRIESTSNIVTWLDNYSGKNYANMSRELVLFTHEYELYAAAGGTLNTTMKNKIVAICQWVKNKGYAWDYPMNRI